MLYIAIFSALLPALMLVLYIFVRDKYQREPWREVLKAFGWGTLSVIPAIFIEVALQMTNIITTEPQTIWQSIWAAFAGAAFPEELSKMFVLWLFLSRSRYFDEYMDGIVYAVAVGMGFAGVENVFYILSNIGDWQSILVARSLTSVPGHYMFAVAMGFFYSMASFYKPHYYAYALLIPILLHGTYDALLFAMRVEGTSAWLLLMGFLVFFIFALVRAAKAIDVHLRTDLDIRRQQQST